MSDRLSVERVQITDLVHDPANVRKHPDKNLAAIKASLARFGQQKPIVVDHNNVVVAGNGTLAAAKVLGWDTIAVVRTELSGAEAAAFAIADNRTGELAEWDSDALASQLSAFTNDLVIGFDEAELAMLIAEPDFSPVDQCEQAKLDQKDPFDCQWCGKRVDPSDGCVKVQ